MACAPPGGGEVTSRTAVTLAGIALVVAGLAWHRSARRVEPQDPPAVAAAPLPQVLDFGRDT